MLRGVLESLSDRPNNTATRRVRTPYCARAITGHADGPD
jgi:hypothetical protein